MSPQLPPVRVGFREDSRGEGHTRVSVFVGRNQGARGHSGELVIRTEEWDELKARLVELPQGRDFFDLLPDLTGFR